MNDFEKEIETLMSRLESMIQKRRPHKAYEQISILGLRAVDVLHRSSAPMTMSELSASLDINLSSASVVVSRLVDMKYVERITDSLDRRVIRIQLTKKSGSKLVETRRKQMRQLYSAAAKGMTVVELKAVTKFMSGIIEAMASPDEK